MSTATEKAKQNLSEAGNKISEAAGNAADAVKNKTNAMSENLKAKEADAKYEVQYVHSSLNFETNNFSKNQATDSNLPVGDRMAAGAKMAEDTVSGGYHKAAEQYYKM